MMKRTFTRFVLLVLIGLGYAVTDSNAQDLSPWTDNPYGNEWIDYSKKYVRVGVPADGIYKVPFGALSTSLKKTPTESITPAQIQLWHRGKEVAIISADNDWVVFYGEKNDGASDGLMFRPGPEARLNPHVSFFSEEGSYFFTISSLPSRIVSVNADPAASTLTAEPYHFERYVKTFAEYEANGKRENPQKTAFSFPTFTDGSALNQSYYERTNAWTSRIIYGPSFAPINGGASQPKSYESGIQLNNVKIGASDKPVFEIVVNGHDEGQHNVKVYLSSTIVDETKLITTIPFSSYGGVKSTIDLEYGNNISELGSANLQVKSVSTDSRDAFGISYFSIVYPQGIDMGGLGSKVFNFKATTNAGSVIAIKNASLNTKVYDITNTYQPRLITDGRYDADNGTLTIQLARTNSIGLQLLVTNPSHIIQELTQINKVDLEPLHGNHTGGSSPKTARGAINPSAYDYLIITNNDSDPVRAGDRDLRAGAVLYAKDFRSQAKGGGYSTLVMDIRTIYDQFNYGEPSAVAIKRFVDYMIQNGVRTKHNLLLIGYSVSLPTNLVKEMPGEVPTFGDPGSDILLVTGLRNSPKIDVPAIPVGRINAFTKAELAIYKSKVSEYERQSAEDSETSLSWRKNIVHLVGAKRNYELDDFKGIFTGVSSHVLQLDPTRKIKVLSNDAAATSATVDAVATTAPMSTEVNAGVGMIAYYGHGNQLGTIYNIGKVSTPGFIENSKYPFIYFNGCGVGNIFTSRGTQMLATDWLITPGKGAVAIFGNSYKSYVSPTKVYIDELYKQIFLRNDQQRRTVGQILVDMASITDGGSPGGRVMADVFSTTNIHQTNLYGDPALRILNTTPPSTLPVELVNFSASLLDSNKISLNWSTAWEKDNSHFIVERSYNAKNYEEIGFVEGKGDSFSTTSYKLIDLEPYAGINYYRLKQVDKSNNNVSGKSTYSKIVSLNLPNTVSFFVYPNPAIEKIDIKLNLPTEIQNWTIVDLNGREMLNGLGSSIDVKKMQLGSYVLEVVTKNGDKFRTSFVKK